MFRLLGSLTVAVLLLIAIAAVLAWGTLYETRFGTAAVQRFIYHSWWFQGMLGFLGVNLAVAAMQRYPWGRRHLPFVLAHLGIILVLVGGILGGRFGIEGQMIIPEGQTVSVLQLPYNVLAVHQPNPGVTQEFRTDFETTAWSDRPHALFEVPTEKGRIQLVVDRYYPDAQRQEEITDEGDEANPAVCLLVSSGGEDPQELRLWLLARDPDRFGGRLGQTHLFFLEPETELQFKQLLGDPQGAPGERGAVEVDFPDLGITRRIPVPPGLDEGLPIEGTPYRIAFKGYFSDFVLSEEGPASRSNEPLNPAVVFTLSGPEGTDAHLLFALHPEFPALHGRTHQIHAHARYSHPAANRLPPRSIALLLAPGGEAPSRRLVAVLTGDSGESKVIDPLRAGVPYADLASEARFEVTAFYPRARRVEYFTRRGNEVRAQALHWVGHDGLKTAEGWMGLGDSIELPLAEGPIRVEYRSAQRELPFSIKLLDFRKIDYPGTQMAAGFESDVELADPEAGLTLRRKISMNNPLKHQGLTFFQSSYLQGPTEATVLSVRGDPGTPLVYAGFLIVILGVVAMFWGRRHSAGGPSA